MASLLNLPRFKLESNQLHGYLQGVWRRNLEWRSFGGSYQHLQATNSVVVIDNVRKRDEERGDDRVSAEEGGEGPSYLDWSFTHKQNVHEDALIFGYRMKCIPDKNGTYMEWTHHNSRCHGNFRPVSSLMTLNFFMEDATIIVSYYILDSNRMSVSIVETSSSAPPTIQYGNMCRVRPENYKSHKFLTQYFQKKQQEENEARDRQGIVTANGNSTTIE
eukprot:g15729.t1